MSHLVVTFPAPGKLLSMNDRDHWRARARKVKDWRAVASYAAQDRTRHPRLLGPSVVHVTLPVADSRRRDPHNYYPTIKAIVDGLVDAGLWPDDTPEWVRTVEPTLAPKAPCVVVTITPMGSMAALLDVDDNGPHQPAGGEWLNVGQVH